MNPAHALALVLIPILSVGGAVLAAWSQRARDAIFFLLVTLAVFAERLQVNFFSEAWYRGTTRGIQISLPEILAFGLLTGTLLGWRRSGGQPRWFWPGSLGLMLLYLLYATISVITAQPKLFGAFELSKIFSGILVFLAAAVYVRTKREWTILIVALGCAVAFEGAWAVKQKFITHLDRVAGTLDHANSLSMYFCLTAPPLIAVAYAGWTAWLRWFGGVCAILAAVGLLLTVSRAGIPVFALVAFGTFLACASWKLNVRLVLIRTGLALASVAVVAALWSQIASRYGEASLREEYLDAHVDGRGIYLRLARNIVADRFFGVGLNNWSYHVSKTYGAQLGFKFDDYDRLVAVHGTEDMQHIFGDAYLPAPAHNLAALTLGELGVPGLLIFLLLWARWFAMGAPFLFGARDDPMRTLGVGLFFGICGIFGQSLTEWVFRQTPILLTFHILLGALASIAYTRRIGRKRPAAAPTRAPMPAPVPLLILQEA
jgi:O-antigen ligase